VLLPGQRDPHENLRVRLSWRARGMCCGCVPEGTPFETAQPANFDRLFSADCRIQSGSLLKQSCRGWVFADTDLVICATVDWQMESLLNLQHVHGEITAPVLYTLTEPHACAGHAVFLPSTSPCLQCGMTLQGKTRIAVTGWPRDTESRSEPACGAVFQPYGPIELQGTLSLAASLALDGLLGKMQHAIHRVWAGPRSLVVEAGGDWSDAWRNGHPERGKGGMQEDWAWEKDDLCPVCGGTLLAKHRLRNWRLRAASRTHPPPSLTT
jgi:hypothetical protein